MCLSPQSFVLWVWGVLLLSFVRVSIVEKNVEGPSVVIDVFAVLYMENIDNHWLCSWIMVLHQRPK